MLTRKDLLLDGIKLPEEDKKVEMALPPSINGSNSNKKKHKRLFSPALFKESLHSNRLGLTIVSIANALIMAIIIVILSTLNINSTSDALKDLFSNADTENTIKSGAIFMYSAFENAGDGYLTFESTENTLENATSTALAKVNDTSTQTQINSAKLIYDATYRLTSGDEKTKNATAKNTTMLAVKASLNNDTSLTDEEKEISYNTISYYFDIYQNDKTKSTSEILSQALPLVLTDTISKQQSLTDETKEEVNTIFTDAFTRAITNNEDSAQVSFETSLSLMKTLSSGMQQTFINNASTALLEKYNLDKAAYLQDRTAEKNIISTEIQSFVFSNLDEYAYYQYLPDFTVEYVTSDRGYPVRYVSTGEFADNGNEIMKEVEVKSYNPSLYTKVKGGMGAKANLLEKMHKEVITGEGYSDEEIAQAKEDAKEALDLIKENLSSFMTDFIKTDENGKNAYHDGSDINDEMILNRVSNIMSSMASQQIIDRYNESNDVKVLSITEITKANYSMSGEEMLNTVQSYVTSGIASYNTYLEQTKAKGYSETDCLLVSTVKGSSSVMSQLPGKVTDSLTDMGDLNTYGVMVGVVGFGIATLLIPMVYTIMLSNNLVANKVETGSLAFTLSTPTRRISFVFTEAMYLLFSEVIMGATLLLVSCLTQSLGVACGGTDLLTSLPIKDICFYALGNFLVTVAISGICFFTSCYFNKSNQAIASGGGITIFFFICSILGLFGTPAIPGTVRINAMNYFNYVTIDYLFDAMAVMNGDMFTYWIKLIGLVAIAIVTYVLGMIRFTKKDLPL